MKSDAGFGTLSLFFRYVRILFVWVLLLLLGSMLQPTGFTLLSDALESFDFDEKILDGDAREPVLPPLLLPEECNTDVSADDFQPRLPVEKRDVRISLGEEKFLIEAELVFHKCSKELLDVRHDMQRSISSGFNDTYMGSARQIQGVFIEQMHLTQVLPEMIVADGSDLVRVIFRGKLGKEEVVKRNEGKSSLTMWIERIAWDAKETHVVISKSPQINIWPVNQVPLDLEKNELRFSDQSGKWQPVELLIALPEAWMAPATSSENVKRTPVAELARAAFGEIDWLQTLWRGLNYALPLLVAMLWARQQRTVVMADAGGLAEVKPAGALLHDSLASFSGLALILVSGLTIFTLGEGIVSKLSRLEWESARMLANFSWNQIDVWIAVFIAFLWPVIARLWMGGRIRQPSMLLVVPLALLTMLAFIAIYWWMKFRLDYDLSVPVFNFFHWDDSDFKILPILMFILAAAVSGVLWLGVEISGASGALRIARSIILGWLLVLSFTFMLQDRLRMAWLAVLIVPFGWVYARTSLAWLRAVWPDAVKWPDWLFLGVVTAFAWLLTMPPSDVGNPNPSWLLSSAVWALLGIWQFFVILTLLQWLQEKSANVEKARLGSYMRGAAAVFMIVLFYWRARQPWIPLLAVLGVGLLLQKYWLFSARSIRIPGKKHTSLLSGAIAEIGFLNDLLLLKGKLRKNLLDKTSKGESGIRDFIDKRAELEQIIKDHEVAGIRARGNAAIALSRGAGGSAWVRGQRGAVMAMIISVPWVISYFWNLSGQIPNMNASAVSQLTTVLMDIGRWPALGFFFLFFYPHIRGYNGIQKGLTLTAALVVPLLAGTILWSVQSPDAWLSLLYWSLQAFICCMILGVGLGDVGALRKVGKGPRHLVEIYNVGTLVAWSSSVVIAASAAVTTVLATQVGSLFTTGLKLLLPDMPVPEK
ncbi:MAG: hypothetical protein KJ914_00895 [Gammaproteobacteria bacterium]|nr:hypothetical protein [Gammaproteobacteria bacterium]MBU1723175.1 hypothetical protein [Gammaproteobacteria bacterium]MBU2005418.1 hypothetical protein [Gammaproteobacteria bacterium]